MKWAIGRLLKLMMVDSFQLDLEEIAVKKGHDIMIGYRGTEMKEGMETVYDMIADIDLFGLGTNAQDGHASIFAAGLILEYEQSDLYVTGHSLGGFLAQVMSYRILEQQLHNAFDPKSSNHSNLKDILLQRTH